MLKNEGVTLQELNKVGYNETYERHLYGLKNYYKNIGMLSQNEHYNLDLAKPFNLYNNSIRISTFEKLNLLERETVQLLMKKLKQKVGEVQFYESQTEAQDNVYKVLNQEKNQIKGQLLMAEAEIQLIKEKWLADVK